MAMMMKPPSSFSTSPAALHGAPVVNDDSTPAQCYGFPPMAEDMFHFPVDHATAEYICCHNTVYAERSGYLAEPAVNLFGRLDPSTETTFYDSVCGLPLFVAPRGRSFGEFREESLAHGWPSFRPAEVVTENVVIHDDGRVESRCRTHLGHNLPDGAGGIVTGGEDRYCIDLVCVAGAPLVPGDDNYKILEIINATDSASETGDGLDDMTSIRSAERGFRDKIGKYSLKVAVEAVCGVMVVAGIYFFGILPLLRKRQRKQYDTLEID